MDNSLEQQIQVLTSDFLKDRIPTKEGLAQGELTPILQATLRLIFLDPQQALNTNNPLAINPEMHPGGEYEALQRLMSFAIQAVVGGYNYTIEKRDTHYQLKQSRSRHHYAKSDIIAEKTEEDHLKKHFAEATKRIIRPISRTDKGNIRWVLALETRMQLSRVFSFLYGVVKAINMSNGGTLKPFTSFEMFFLNLSIILERDEPPILADIDTRFAVPPEILPGMGGPTDMLNTSSQTKRKGLPGRDRSVADDLHPPKRSK